MTVPELARRDPPMQAGELETLTSFLDYFRQTLAWKCSELSAQQLNATLPPSSMSLAGIRKHLAFVEDYWFSTVLTESKPSEPWLSVDWAADEDWDWHSATKDSPAEQEALWGASMDRSEAVLNYLEEKLDGDLLAFSVPLGKSGRRVSVRWVLVHMIEEYARHCGHADLIRESIDGSTGD